jgi:hypothetical protein
MTGLLTIAVAVYLLCVIIVFASYRNAEDWSE